MVISRFCCTKENRRITARGRHPPLMPALRLRVEEEEAEAEEADNRRSSIKSHCCREKQNQNTGKERRRGRGCTGQGRQAGRQAASSRPSQSPSVTMAGDTLTAEDDNENMFFLLESEVGGRGQGTNHRENAHTPLVVGRRLWLTVNCRGRIT